MENLLSRLSLKKVELEDFEYWKNEFDPNIKLTDFENILKEIDDGQKRGSSYSFWFEPEGNKVGFVQIFGVMKHPFHSGYMEISIFEKFRKQGLAKKAIKCLEVFCFKELGLKKLVAPIRPENYPSIALFSSLGYEKTHTDPYAFFFQGKAMAHEIYVKVNDL